MREHQVAGGERGASVMSRFADLKSKSKHFCPSGADRHPGTTKPAGASTGTGPKLKDYLQYMTGGGGGGVGPLSMSLPGTAAATDVPIPYQPVISGPESDVRSAMTPQLPSTINSGFTDQVPQTHLYAEKKRDPTAVPFDSDISQLPQSMMPTEMRPAPVGSEQTDIPQSYCSSGGGGGSSAYSAVTHPTKITSLADYEKRSYLSSQNYTLPQQYGAIGDSRYGPVGGTQQTTYPTPYSEMVQPSVSVDSRLPSRLEPHLQGQYHPAVIPQPTSQTTFSSSYQDPSLKSTWHPGSQTEIPSYPSTSISAYTSGSSQGFPGYTSYIGPGTVENAKSLPQSSHMTGGTYGQRDSMFIGPASGEYQSSSTGAYDVQPGNVYSSNLGTVSLPQIPSSVTVPYSSVYPASSVPVPSSASVPSHQVAPYYNEVGRVPSQVQPPLPPAASLLSSQAQPQTFISSAYSPGMSVTNPSQMTSQGSLSMVATSYEPPQPPTAAPLQEPSSFVPYMSMHQPLQPHPVHSAVLPSSTATPPAHSATAVAQPPNQVTPLSNLDLLQQLDLVNTPVIPPVPEQRPKKSVVSDKHPPTLSSPPLSGGQQDTLTPKVTVSLLWSLI